jgi:hypothetical protein
MPREEEANLRTYLERMSRQVPVDGTRTQLACKHCQANTQQILGRRQSIRHPRKSTEISNLPSDKELQEIVSLLEAYSRYQS